MSRGRQGGLATAASLALVVSAMLSGVPVGEAIAAGDNDAPLADAGLDQTVSANTTVHLDATGSRDPDGEIRTYAWRLEQPDGNYTAPACQTCGQTSFVATQTGTYNATITVTDDEGATRTDTLHVHVEPSDGPSVSLSGPKDVVEGRFADYSASVSAGATELAAVVWRVDGQFENRTAVAGASATTNHSEVFTSDGTVTIAVTAVDRLGRQRTARTNVTVTAASPVSSGAAASSGEGCSQFGEDDGTYCDNDRMTLDSNGITISDADNDGSVEWAGVTLDEAFAANNDGVTYDSTDGVAKFESQEAYKEAVGVDTVNVDPTAEVNENGTLEDGIQSLAHVATMSDSSNDTPSEDEGAGPTSFLDIAGLGGSDTGGSDDSGDDSSESDGTNTNTQSGRVPPSNGSPGTGF
ncbi:PKD domain-containing protein [Halosimplex salinum]|uniref:PKD domain-containing protein n=1 Tax=Halosimplex salinum TaxID=1710538 RepID=UPI000F49C623|nr:PKD domain-containing protein [Halosimplex salinum]